MQSFHKHFKQQKKMFYNETFANKVVLVTGASSGIGEAIALHFASLTASLTITGRDNVRLEAVAQKCKQCNPKSRVLRLIADVTKLADLKKIITETLDYYGRLDVLVNNAGIFQIPSISDPSYMSAFDGSIECNLKSVVQLTKLAVPYLIESKGNVVNISSVASVKPMVNNSIYSMTKAGIDAFTKCMALELGPQGVRVNAINPASIRTPVFDKMPGLSTDLVASGCAISYPLRRIGEPDDCSKAVAYLASDDASFVTGVCLLIDGGSAYTELRMS